MSKINLNEINHINSLNDLLNNNLDFDINSKEQISIFLVIDNIKEAVAKTGKTYISFSGKEADSVISCRAWGCNLKDFSFIKSNEKIKNGDLVKIIGTIEEYNGAYQITVHQEKGDVYIRKVNDKDNINSDYFFKKAPIPYQEMITYIKTTINSFKDDDFKKLCNIFLDKYSKELEYYPAGKSNHHAYKTGLLYHMYNMLKQGECISSIYNLNRELLLTGILFHDCGKIITLNSNKYGIVSEFNTEYVLLEHLVQGILIIEQLGKEANMPKEKVLLLQHMIASHHGKPEWGSPIYPSFPEAEALHHIDNLDSKLIAMDEELNKLGEEDTLTDRIYSLDRRILYKYKPQEENLNI